MDNLPSYHIENLIFSILDGFLEFTYRSADRVTRESLILLVQRELAQKQILALPLRISKILTRYFEQKNCPGFYTHVNRVKKFVFAGVRLAEG